MKTDRKSSEKQAITAVKQKFAKLVDVAVEDGGQVMGSLVPFDTGHLESRLIARSDGQGNGYFENDAPYGKFVEFGTYKMAAQPFFRPGVDAARQRIRKGR